MGDLVTLIEQTTGHDVAVLDAGPDEHGLTMRDPERDVTFIGVARSRNPMRQRSMLAHELGHVLFGDWNGGGDLSARSSEEIRADSFARHLLVPREGLKVFLGSRESLGEADLSAVVQWFLFSPALAAIALQDAGYIDAATKAEWMSLSHPPTGDSLRMERSIPLTSERRRPHPFAAAAARPSHHGIPRGRGFGAGHRHAKGHQRG